MAAAKIPEVHQFRLVHDRGMGSPQVPYFVFSTWPYRMHCDNSSSGAVYATRGPPVAGSRKRGVVPESRFASFSVRRSLDGGPLDTVDSGRARSKRSLFALLSMKPR